MGFGTFVFFGLICIIGAAFVYFFVPETKNLTLEEMDEIFGDEAGNALADRDRLNKIYVTLGLLSVNEVRGMSIGDKDMVIGHEHSEKTAY